MQIKNFRWKILHTKNYFKLFLKKQKILYFIEFKIKQNRIDSNIYLKKYKFIKRILMFKSSFVFAFGAKL